MGDKNYRRTTGQRNLWKRMCWLPRIWNDIATMRSGRKYAVRKDGWRRMEAV